GRLRPRRVHAAVQGWMRGVGCPPANQPGIRVRSSARLGSIGRSPAGDKPPPIRRRFEKALRSNGTGLEVLWPAASMPSDPARLQLSEVLDFRPDLGVIRLHEQRVVILSAAALGLLRQALIDTLGVETARRLLLRFG